MAMKGAPTCMYIYTCCCKEKMKAKLVACYNSTNWYLSFVIWKFSSNEKGGYASTDFSWVPKGGRHLVHFSTSSLCRIMLLECVGLCIERHSPLLSAYHRVQPPGGGGVGANGPVVSCGHSRGMCPFHTKLNLTRILVKDPDGNRILISIHTCTSIHTLDNN